MKQMHEVWVEQLIFNLALFKQTYQMKIGTEAKTMKHGFTCQVWGVYHDM